MKTIVKENVTCPKCGGHEFIESFANDGCYICKNYVGNEYECNLAGVSVCRKCNKEYPNHRFAIVNSMYYCKECDKIQWGLTEYLQDSINWARLKKHIKISDL